MILSLLFFVGCKKEPKNTIIIGTVFSNVENAPIPEVNVKFFKKNLSGNSFSNSFELLEEKTTGDLGRFEVEFLKTSSDIEYKFELFNPEYGAETILISPEDLATGEENVFTYNLVPTATVNFNIKSTSNMNASDEMLFNFSNNLSAGQSFINKLYVGGGVDEVLTTLIIAERYNRYTYILKRNNQTLTVQDSIFVSKGNVATKELLY